MKTKVLVIFIVLFTSNLFSQYVLYWSDEFVGTSLDMNKWSYETGGGGWGNQESQYYTSGSNTSFVNGMLRITAKEEAVGGSQYTSSRIITKNHFAVRYGKIEASIKMPFSQGIWPAFWMLGTNISTVGWPKCGEIDIMEHVSTDPQIHGTVHYANGSNQHTSIGYGVNCDVTQFHTYSIEWSPSYIKWFLDGVQYYQTYIQNGVYSTEEFHLPFFILLNMAVGGQWPGYPNSSTVFPAEMDIDYVRVYVDQAQVGVDENSSSKLLYGPNPVENNFEITFPNVEAKKVKVKLYGADGTLISEVETLCTDKLILNTEMYSNGIYFLELNDGSTLNERIKFVKLK